MNLHNYIFTKFITYLYQHYYFSEVRCRFHRRQDFKCKGRGVFEKNGDFRLTQPHNHDPPEVSSLKRKAFHEELKDDCIKKRLLGQPKTLFEQVADK